MIRLRGVSKKYGDGSLAVDDLSLDIPRGQVTVLIGPSGCGKTTTLKMINRLVEPTAGIIEVGGEDIMSTDAVQLRRHLGYVIQQSGLFPHWTVNENVATVLKLLRWKKEKRRARVAEMLDLVGLDPAVFGRRYPHQLSGGQRQRVGVARALAADPPVLLMDEPFGAVDPVQRGRLQQEFRKLQDELQKTVVLVTHDIEEAVRLGDKMAVLQEGGRLAQFDPPAWILGDPSTEFVADFVGDDRLVTRLEVASLQRHDVMREASRATGGVQQLSVHLGDSLRRVLQVLMESPSGQVDVFDGSEWVGVMTPTSLHQAVRRSLPTPDAEPVASP